MTPEERENYLATLTSSAAVEGLKQQAINDNLPSWAQVESALDGISSLAEAKIALKRIARVVYWLAKNKGE